MQKLQIIGSSNANAGKYPYMVSLDSQGGHFCGGSLIRRESRPSPFVAVPRTFAFTIRFYSARHSRRRGRER